MKLLRIVPAHLLAGSCLAVSCFASSGLDGSIPAAWAVSAALVPGELETKTFERAWSLIDRYFYDSDHNGLDWDAIGEKYRPEADAAESPQEIRDVMQRMLAELGVSHCSVLDADVYRGMMAELANKRTETFGLQIEESEPGRFYARALFEGGPAEVAGVRLGDRILRIDSEPVEESALLVDAGYDPALDGPSLYFLNPSEAASVTLTIQSNVDPDTRRNVELRAVKMNGVDAMKNSARVESRDGFEIGVIHIWYCSRGVGPTLRDAVTRELAECDGLVVDLRGRGGYSDVVEEILEVFRGSSGGLIERLRSGGSKKAPLWKKPVVFLIDGRSRSAKEILAYRVRDEGIGTLVGERTEGAVLGATFHPLPDGSYLELPGVAVPVGGVSLEGVGVAPDIEATVDLPFAEGRDGILEAGLDEAVARIQAFRRGPY